MRKIKIINNTFIINFIIYELLLSIYLQIIQVLEDWTAAEAGCEKHGNINSYNQANLAILMLSQYFP